jgi:ABC-type nickel/cobalt efflux system permease component RcnA
MNPLYLRAASILIPLPFGYSLYRRTWPRFMPTIVMGLISGVVAVAGMSAVVGLVDHVQIMPADARDWREVIEYALSIALAFLLGCLLAQSIRLIRTKVTATLDPDAAMSVLGKASKSIAMFTVGANQDGTLALAKRIQSIEKLMNSATAGATAAGSIYAGVKAFL